MHNAGEGGLCGRYSNPETARLVQKYRDGETFIAIDGQEYAYGASVKNLDLRGKSADEIRDLLTETGSGWKSKREYLGEAEYGQQYPHDIYYHPDGGMVRVKPNGSPFGKRRAPHFVKSVQIQPGEDTGFANEAFKVDHAGEDGPKWDKPDEMQYPEDVGDDIYEADGETLTPAAQKYADDEMDRLHTNFE